MAADLQFQPAPKIRCGRVDLAVTRPGRAFFTNGADLRMASNLVQGALFTVMVVRAGLVRDAAFDRELEKQVERRPRFFLIESVVLDLKDAEVLTIDVEFLDVGDGL